MLEMPQIRETPPQSWSALVVDDDPGIRQSLRLCLEAAGGRVLGVGTAAAALDALDRMAYDVVLIDLWLGPDSGMSLTTQVLARQPSIGVIVITAFATFESAVDAMKRGAADYLPKPFTPDQVRLAVQRVLEGRRLQHRVLELEQQLVGADVEPVFETRNAGYRTFLDVARRGAGSDAVVLLRGESGAGKNVLAHWIRAHSSRRNTPFVTVNCPMLSSDQLSRALFGHKPDGVTTEDHGTGKLQEAEGGTLFIDEVADLTPDAQARLLRFMNDQTYERYGDLHQRRANVRIIAATRQPIDALVTAGKFREDLLFRLNVLSMTVPPLRDRPEDIPLLADHFLSFFAARQRRVGLSFSRQSVAAMVSHPWPGNLRALRNAIERAVILGPTAILEPGDLGLEPSVPSRPDVAIGELVSIDQIEREHIARVVAKVPTLEIAARVLGIDATTLSRKRKRYQLS